MQASCKDLFEELLDKLSSSEYVWPPPKEMPQELYSNFTLNGRVQVWRYAGYSEALQCKNKSTCLTAQNTLLL